MIYRTLIFLKLLLALAWAGKPLNLYLIVDFPIAARQISYLAISSNSRFLACATDGGEILLWDLSLGKVLRILNYHNKRITQLVFDSQNSLLVSGSVDKKISLWDLYSGQQVRVIDQYKSKVRSIALSPDDRLLAVGGDQDDIYLFEFPLGMLKGKMRGHKKRVLYLSFNRNGDQMVSVSKDRQIITWDVGQQRIVRKTEIVSRTLKNSGIDVLSASASFDKYFIAIGLQERVLAKGGKRMIFRYNLAFYDWEHNQEIALLEGNRKEINFFVVSPDKNYVITDNSTLRETVLSIWNIQIGMIEQNFNLTGKITALAMSQDGKWLAAGVTGGKEFNQSRLYLWRVSGVSGYQKFSSGSSMQTRVQKNFGGAIKLTTPGEPLIRFGEKKRIAVMYFDHSGIEEDIARTTTYLLESQLGNSPFVDLVERNQIESVLSELSYQMSGITAVQATQVGRHLGADYIMIGSINRLGNLLIITSKLVNVETSRIEGTREVQCNNVAIEDIAEMISLLSRSIVAF